MWLVDMLCGVVIHLENFHPPPFALGDSGQDLGVGDEEETLDGGVDSVTGLG